GENLCRAPPAPIRVWVDPRQLPLCIIPTIVSTIKKEIAPLERKRFQENGMAANQRSERHPNRSSGRGSPTASGTPFGPEICLSAEGAISETRNCKAIDLHGSAGYSGGVHLACKMIQRGLGWIRVAGTKLPKNVRDFFAKEGS